MMMKNGAAFYEALLKFDGREIVWAIKEEIKAVN